MPKSELSSIGHQYGGVLLSSLWSWTVVVVVCLLLLGGLSSGRSYIIGISTGIWPPINPNI